MKIKLLGFLFFIALSAHNANAQNDFDGRSLAGIKQDFRAVGAVARVKIKNIVFAAAGAHSIYAVESEIIEVFKGGVKKSGNFTFYFDAEEDYDVKKLVGKEYIVFLEKEVAVPSGGKAWLELENSKAPASERIIAQLRRLKKTAPKN